MFDKFTSALILKIVKFLEKEPDFFNLDEKKKSNLLEDLKIPDVFKDYLQKSSEKNFLNDLSLLVTNTHKSNGLSKALSLFFTGDFARKLDLIDNEFYLMTTKERTEIVEKLINSESSLAGSLKEILVNRTYQQISAEIFNLSTKVETVPYILVQSPREIEPEMKKEIRAKIREENPLNFPIFQINKKLIGGIRIFRDGECEDQSWLSRVLHFTNLTTV